MCKRYIWALIGLMSIATLPRATAMSEGIMVTKDTQAKEGLKYTLSAVRVSDTAVIVQMEIPKKGKLQALRRVMMDIGTGNGSPIVSADLQTKAIKDSAVQVTFQLSPQMAEKCSIDLIVEDPKASLSDEIFYSVELKSYITVRK